MVLKVDAWAYVRINLCCDEQRLIFYEASSLNKLAHLKLKPLLVSLFWLIPDDFIKHWDIPSRQMLTECVNSYSAYMPSRFPSSEI